jgi:multicomponent Na+:H+ antiporter subunit B
MRKFAILVSVIVGALLMWGSTDFPDWSDPNSPASTHLSNEYIEQAYETSHVPNLVSAILADYRNFDTMFETTVVFTAGTAIFLILRLPLGPLARRRNSQHPQAIRQPLPRDPILEMACRVLFPPTHLFGLYVLTHGHYSPGGGFQAGVILGASFILLAIGFDMRAILARFPEGLYKPLAALGVLLYAGLGAICIALGENFLDYEALRSLAPSISQQMIRSHGILLVECGVTLTVGSVIFSIYTNLASRGNHKGGL